MPNRDDHKECRPLGFGVSPTFARASCGGVVHLRCGAGAEEELAQRKAPAPCAVQEIGE
jgi:hypothetical protein